MMHYDIAVCPGGGTSSTGAKLGTQGTGDLVQPDRAGWLFKSDGGIAVGDWQRRERSREEDALVLGRFAHALLDDLARLLHRGRVWVQVGTQARRARLEFARRAASGRHSEQRGEAERERKRVQRACDEMSASTSYVPE